MQKITQEEFEKMEFRNGGRYVRSLFQLTLEKLEIGEMIKVEKNEWRRKTDLTSAVINMGKSSKMKFSARTLLDNSGWIVKRIA